MIERLSKISKILMPYRWLSFVLLGVFLAVIIYVNLYLPLSEQNLYNLPCLLAIIWIAAFNVAIAIFDKAPVEPAEKQSFFARLKGRLTRFFYYIIVFGFIILTLAIILLSLRFLGILSRF
ncbi:hypothetical protein AAD001_12285 [Colwelliaceae bacterium 6471]